MNYRKIALFGMCLWIMSLPLYLFFSIEYMNYLFQLNLPIMFDFLSNDIKVINSLLFLVGTILVMIVMLKDDSALQFHDSVKRES